MRRSHSRIVLALIKLAVLVGIIGCNSSDLTQPGTSEIENAVPAAGQSAAFAAPDSDLVGSMIVDMMQQLVGAPTPATGGVSAGTTGPTCAPTFDLGNGITGTCSISGSVVTWTFGGTVLVEGDAVTVSGTLVAAPDQTQPETGSRFTIDYDATASGARGDATWSSFGTVTRDAADQVVDFIFDMTHTITPTGHPTSVVNIRLTPTQLELIATGPLGGVLRFVLDRETMTGTVSLNGFEVALVSISNGCTTIDFILPAIPDRVVCGDG